MKGNKKKSPPKKQQGVSASASSVLIVLAILVLTAFLYSRSVGNGFVTWDDPEYVLDNPIIKDFSAHGIKVMFTSFYEGNYHPLTALSNAIEYHYFKINPKPYHITNLIFHLLNVLLVFLIVARLSNRRDAAAIVALFFGIHPLHVESVAWIAERKDVLYSFFFLAAWLSYILYLKMMQKPHLIVYSLLLFCCALLSKSMAVTFPVVMLLTDYYINRKINARSLLEKIPFFLVALVIGAVAIHSQSSSGSTVMAPHFPMLQRILLSSYGLLYYIFKLFMPVHIQD